MELNSLEKLIEKKFDKGIFRRWICLLLAIIMLIPAWGGVLAADVDVDLVNEAYKEIILWKTDISQFRSAIWWTKDGGTKGIDHPIYDEDARTTAFFLSALMEKLNISHTFKANDDNIASGLYTVTATVLGEKYKITIEGTTGENWESNGKEIWVDIPTDEDAEKLQYQYEINILLEEIEAGLEEKLKNLQSEITDSTATTDPKHAKVTAEKLKEIKAKAVVYGKEIKSYEDKIINITLKAIGVAVLDYNDIDKKISELQIIVEDIENKVIKRGNELPGEINEETKAKLQKEVDEIIGSIGEIVKNLVTIENDLKTSLDLIELEKIKVKIDAYEREVTSHENRFKAIKELPLEVLPDFKTIEDGIFKVKVNLESVKTALGGEIAKERENDAGLKIQKAEKDKTNADVTEAKKAVALIEDNDKSKFEKRIEYVEQVIKAIAAVDKAVKSNKADDYGVADALVNGDSASGINGLDDDTDPVKAPHDVKKGLSGKLEELKLIIDADAKKSSLAEAAKAVTAAETALNKYADGKGDTDLLDRALKNAVDKINEALKNNVPHNVGDLYVLIIKLGVTVEDKSSTPPITPAKATKDDSKGFHLKAKEVTEVITEIEKKEAEILGKTTLEGGSGLKSITKDSLSTVVKDRIQYLGKGLNTRIDDIYKVIDTMAGFDANNIKTLADIKVARTAVTKLSKKFELTKAILNAEITKLEEEIKSNEPKTSVGALEKAYGDVIGTTATSLEIATLIKTAKTLIGKETDNIRKIRLNAVFNAIDTAQKAKEAVALAEATMLRKDYDKAANLVNQIPDSVKLDIVLAPSIVDYNFTVFKSDSAKDNGLKYRLNKIIGPIGQAENEKAARDAVAKVEKSLTRKDYITASQALNKNFSEDFGNNGEKDNLQARLGAVNTVITVTEEVVAAEKSLQEYLADTKNLKKINMGNIIADTKTMIENINDEAYVDNKAKLNERMAVVIESASAIAEVMKAEDALAKYLLANATNEINLKADLDTAITAANTFIKSNTLDTKVKANLEKRLDFVRDELIKNGDINTAKGTVEKAEKDLYDKLEVGVKGIADPKNYKKLSEIGFETDKQAIIAAITDAENAVKNLKGTEADKLKKRVTSVKNAMDIAVLISEAEKDGLNKAKVDAATKALAKMGDSYILVTATPKNITVKDYYQARVDDLNAILVKSQQFEEAMKLTQKALDTLSEGDINKAIDYVSKMQNETDRADFNTGNTGRKINGIKNIVDKLAGTVRDKINGAIPLVAVNDKTAAKAVTDAKKSFESFKKIVGEANKKLVGIQENPIVAYKEIYEKPQAGDPKVGGHIPHYNSSLGVLDKSLNIWKLMIAAEKSKKKEDVEAIRKIHLVGMTLEDTVDENGKKTEGIKTLIGSVDPAAMTVHVDLYKSIADGLENKQKELEGYQKGEEGRQEEAQIAINDAKDVLYNYATDKSVGEDVYEIEARKDKVRIDLTIKISSARMAIESIKDAPVKKAKLAELGKIEVYRDAIAAVGNALAYPTQATYKAAESAVKKCSYDYGLVLAELQSELRVINDILDSYAKAEKATKLVEIAEETKLQSDVDKARMAVDMLDDSNPAKIPLGKRLDKVQEFINTKDGVDTAASNTARELLGKALVNITQASRYFNLTALGDKDIRDAYSLLRGEEGKDENGDPIIVAGARHFIRDAISEINKISDILLKETLNRLVIQREEELQNALHEIHIKASERLLGVANEATNERLALATDRSKVESGEWTEKQWTEERLRLEQIARKAIEEARNTIDEMFLPGFMTQKDNLMKWLNQIIGDLANENAEDRYIRAEKMIKEASDAVEKAARSREEADKDKFNIDLKAAKDAIFFAQQAIHAIPEGYNTDKVEGLQKVLDGLQMLWQNISDGVSDEKTIAEARALIEIVKQKLKAWKAGDETEKNVEIAFTIARNKVMGIIDNAKRTELNLELDALEEQFTTDGGQVIIPDDGKNKQSDFDRAKAAVLKAVESRLQKDVDAARKLVAKLVDGPSKDAMNRILDGIIIEKTEEEKRKEEEEKRKEEEAKKKAEEARKKKYPGIDDALNSKDRDKNNPDAKWGKENEFKKK